MHAGLGGNGHSDTTEVGSGVACHERVSDPTDHLGESYEGLRVLLVGQETVAFHDGRLHIAESWRVREKPGRERVEQGGGGGGEGRERGIQSRDKFPNGGDLEEPVATSLLPGIRDLVRGEVLRQHHWLAGSRQDYRGLATDPVVHQVPCGCGLRILPVYCSVN